MEVIIWFFFVFLINNDIYAKNADRMAWFKHEKILLD